MNKKKILSLVLSCLILGQGATTTVLAKGNTPQNLSKGDIIWRTPPVLEQTFGAHENGGYYKHDFVASLTKGDATINFDSPAWNFTLFLKDENGKTILKSDFVKANNGEGVNHLKVEFKLNVGETYTFKIINNDSTPISGCVSLSV